MREVSFRPLVAGLVFVALLAFCALAVPCAGTAQSSAQQGASSQDQTTQSPPGQAKDDSSATKDDKGTPHGMTRIRISVTSNAGKPVENASVYVRFNQEGGFLRKDKMQELDLKTNQDGSVKVPPVPQGKILVQVVAKGWKTFGQWYDIATGEKTIEIKLDPPPHWY